MNELGILVALQTTQSSLEMEYQVQELKDLCMACDINIVQVCLQKATKIHPVTYIGSGKAKEIKQILDKTQLTIVVFMHELSGSQIRNLENILQVKVYDRTDIILHIFSKRAQTKEAHLQVEIARLRYSLPRLIGNSTKNDRQSGGRNKGLGETNLELSRRRIESRIHSLEKQLEVVKKNRESQKQKRMKNQIKKVALVGYTNSGKSSLLNAFLSLANANKNKHVFTKNMLFATLDPYTRLIEIQGYPPILVTDTVGFVSNLPHTLVKSFRSTLENVLDADLLIHVVDRSNPLYEKKIETTLETLSEIEAHNIPLITIYNKIDQMEEPITSTHICISAKQHLHIDILLQEITNQLYPNYHKLHIFIPYEDMKFYQDIQTQYIQTIKPSDLGYQVSCICSPTFYQEHIHKIKDLSILEII